MSDDTFIKTLDCIGALAKWFILQMLLYFLMPYLWNYEYAIETMTLVFIYTAFHVIYWTFIPKEMRIKWLWTPYITYTILALMLYVIVDNWCSSISFCLLLPLLAAMTALSGLDYADSSGIDDVTIPANYNVPMFFAIFQQNERLRLHN